MINLDSFFISWIWYENIWFLVYNLENVVNKIKWID